MTKQILATLLSGLLFAPLSANADCGWGNAEAANEAAFQQDHINQARAQLAAVEVQVGEKQRYFDSVNARVVDKKAVVTSALNFVGKLEMLVNGLNLVATQLRDNQRDRAEIASKLSGLKPSDIEIRLPSLNISDEIRGAIFDLLKYYAELAKDHNQLAAESLNLTLLALSSENPDQSSQSIATARDALIDVIKGTTIEVGNENGEITLLQPQFDQAGAELSAAQKSRLHLRDEIEIRTQKLNTAIRDRGSWRCSTPVVHCGLHSCG